GAAAKITEKGGVASSTRQAMTPPRRGPGSHRGTSAVTVRDRGTRIFPTYQGQFHNFVLQSKRDGHRHADFSSLVQYDIGFRSRPWRSVTVVTVHFQCSEEGG